VYQTKLQKVSKKKYKTSKKPNINERISQNTYFDSKFKDVLENKVSIPKEIINWKDKSNNNY